MMPSGLNWTGALDRLSAETASDVTALALPEPGARGFRWVYIIGNRSERYRPMVVKPGIGTAGLALKLGRHVLVDEADGLELRGACPMMISERLITALALPVAAGPLPGAGGVLLLGRRVGRPYAAADVTAAEEAAVWLLNTGLRPQGWGAQR